jgi:hypothetical protein
MPKKELTRRGDELAWRRQAYKKRMGWSFPWASSFGSEFNDDFGVTFTAEQQRSGTIEYNFRAMATRTELTDQQTLVDGVDANARSVVGRRCDVVPRHVGRDDGCDDAAVPGADAVALPPGRWYDRRDAPRCAHRARGYGLFLRVDPVRNGRLSAGRRAGGVRDAAAGAGARRSDRVQRNTRLQ